VLLVHGLFANHTIFFGCGAERLARRRRTILYDLPGHGLTSADGLSDYRLATLADELLGLLDVLDVGRADLVGFSFGSAGALKAALQAPGRIGRLALIEAYGLLGVADPAEQAAVAPDADSAAAGRRRAAQRRRAGFSADADLLEGERRSLSRARAHGLMTDGRLVDSLRQDEGFFRNAPLEQVSQPTLLLYGWRSPYLHDGRLAVRRLPNARLRLTWGSHDLPLRRSGWVAHHLDRFLGPVGEPPKAVP
jgi:pimeloyl-ACP methyl ester carboxylesterase